ncbi:hypothetical protein MAM1_0408d10372 [Mucor ambiguus]|uniref:Uncharacterized protein n=1 Tax=Mucor ambiguus TaxID=91626 RepID=A0A0C9N437_9FUNG|nr:hypothetical protein MAM1_0408d10372 [Mucor ambiguus]
MPPSLSQFTTYPKSLPPGPSQGCHRVGFSPGKSPPTALIRIENNNTFENCCTTIHDNNHSPDNSIQSLPRNIASPSTKNSTSLRFMPYKRPSAAAAASKAKENDPDLALFGPVPSADSFSFASSLAATSGPVTPPPPTAREGDLTELVLDDEMVFQEFDCITNSLRLPYSPPLSPTTSTASNSSSFLDDDFMNVDFVLFP